MNYLKLRTHVVKCIWMQQCTGPPEAAAWTCWSHRAGWWRVCSVASCRGVWSAPRMRPKPGSRRWRSSAQRWHGDGQLDDSALRSKLPFLLSSCVCASLESAVARLPETEGPDWHCTTCGRPVKLPSCLRREGSSGCRLWSTIMDRKHIPIKGRGLLILFFFLNTATNRHDRSWLSCFLSLCCLVWFYFKGEKKREGVWTHLQRQLRCLDSVLAIPDFHVSFSLDTVKDSGPSSPTVRHQPPRPVS